MDHPTLLKWAKTIACAAEEGASGYVLDRLAREVEPEPKKLHYVLPRVVAAVDEQGVPVFSDAALALLIRESGCFVAAAFEELIYSRYGPLLRRWFRYWADNHDIADDLRAKLF